MQPGSWGKAAAGLEDLTVCNFSALLHAGQSGNLGPAAFFLSIHVASPGPRYPEHGGLHPAFLSEGSGMSATPGASDLILVELSGGQPALSDPCLASERLFELASESF